MAWPAGRPGRRQVPRSSNSSESWEQSPSLGTVGAVAVRLVLEAQPLTTLSGQAPGGTHSTVLWSREEKRPEIR